MLHDSIYKINKKIYSWHLATYTARKILSEDFAL